MLSKSFYQIKVGDKVTLFPPYSLGAGYRGPSKVGLVTKLHTRKGALIGFEAFKVRWTLQGRQAGDHSYRGDTVGVWQKEHDAQLAHEQHVRAMSPTIETIFGLGHANKLRNLTTGELNGLFMWAAPIIARFEAEEAEQVRLDTCARCGHPSKEHRYGPCKHGVTNSSYPCACEEFVKPPEQSKALFTELDQHALGDADDE